MPAKKISQWQMADPVKLSQGKVVLGQTTNAAEFNGEIFVFADEESRD